MHQPKRNAARAARKATPTKESHLGFTHQVAAVINNLRSDFTKHVRIGIIPLPSTIAGHPMPPELSDEEILRSAAPLGVILGFLLLSWPDGTRVAVSSHLTAFEGVAVYRAARASIEKLYRELAVTTQRGVA
jgi:hypothetical protein